MNAFSVYLFSYVYREEKPSFPEKRERIDTDTL